MPTEQGYAETVESERVSASLRALSFASKALAATFDYRRALAQVWSVVVPAFADGVRVDLDDDPLPLGTAQPGRHDPAGLSESFPLVAHGRDLGVLRVTRLAVRGRLDPLDHAFFDELAVHIALAVDGARLLAREHHVADTLQRALLPEKLPLHPRLHFDAAYVPGGGEGGVGGDWYDAFALPDGRLALSIGDVAGHGLAAALVMGEVRQAFRAAALGADAPSLVLERANSMVHLRPNPVMVTAIFAIIDPASATLTYATAGHPPPILTLPCVTARTLPSAGIPLGIEREVGATDWTFTLPPGSLVAFYTDGLSEWTRDAIAGESRLLEAMQAEVLRPSGTPARTLMHRISGGATGSDDAAALVVSVADEQPATFHYEFSAIPFGVPLARRALERYLTRLGVESDERHALLTAAGEALANAVEHAYTGQPGLVRLRAQPTSSAIDILVEDDGRWRQAQRRPERGRGLPLMRALMDGVEIRTGQSHTAVRLSLTR